jgi:RNA polymerase sigma-70 factor (ECF subfamily)
MLSTDSAALEYAFARYRGDIYAFVLSRLRNREDAAELTQQTFVDAAAALSRGVVPRTMRGWLFAVAARRVTDELRRRGRRSALVEPEPGADVAVEPALAAALGRLAADERRLLFMRYVEERSHAEIAAALGCNAAASRMRASRALARLRRELGADV